MSAVRGFDVVAFHLALDDRRDRRAMTWSEVGADVQTTPAQLGAIPTRPTVGIKAAMRLTGWLDRPASEFVVDVPV